MTELKNNSLWTVTPAKLMEWFVFVSLISFAIADAATTYIQFQTKSYEKISIFPRSIFEVFALLFLIVRVKILRNSLKLLVISISLFGMFIIGFGTYQTRKIDADWFVALQFFNKQIYVFICFAVVWEMRNLKGFLNYNNLSKVYEIIIYINAAAIFCGLIFNIDWLSSYRLDEKRFGYMGFIPAVNEAALFWIIALFYGLLVFGEEKRIVPLFVSLICCFLLGAKAALFFSIFVLIIYGILFYRKIAILICSLILISIISVIPFIYQNIQDYFRSLTILSYFFYRADLGVSLWSILISGRDVYITRFVENITHYWSFINYLFGGQDRVCYLIEMDIFDTPLFFGIVGTIVYFLGFYFILNKIKPGIRGLFCIVFFSMAFLGGHVFWSAINSLYLSLFVARAAQINLPDKKKNKLLGLT